MDLTDGWQDEKRDRKSSRPRIDEDRHCCRKFSSRKPVGDHLGHQNAQEHTTGTGDETPADLASPGVYQRHHEAAHEHKHGSRQYCWFVAEPLADRPTRQSENCAWSQIETDQEPNIGKVKVELTAQQRCDGSNALKLKRHSCTNGKEESEYTPAATHDQVNTLELSGPSTLTQSRLYFLARLSWMMPIKRYHRQR